jgi:hypothetical protein
MRLPISSNEVTVVFDGLSTDEGADLSQVLHGEGFGEEFLDARSERL